MIALADNPLEYGEERKAGIKSQTWAVNSGKLKAMALQYLIATLAIAAVTLVCLIGGQWIGKVDAIMFYFATTFLLAYRSTLGPALWASIISLILFDYFIAPPFFQFELAHAYSFSILLILILLTSRQRARLVSAANEMEETVDRRTAELAQSNKLLSEEIEKRKIIEEKLRNTVSELGRSNAMLNQFARIASHDLQEPLRVIQGYVGLLDSRYRSALDKTGQDFLGYIVDGSKRMEGLVKGVLEHARVSYDTRQFQILDFNDALTDARANLAQRLEETGAIVTQDRMPSLLAHRNQIVQLFQNLIANAIKFRKDDVCPMIHVSCREEQDNYIFAVEDNGIGIENEYQRQVFDMFKRLHSTKQYPGNGLGLAICKAIVDQHGGKIWVESEAGIGSKFCFSIPSPKQFKN